MSDYMSRPDGPFGCRLEICRLLIKERKRVGNHLGFELCPVPAWDMLLDLYVAYHEARGVQIWSLCLASNIPTSTAHRKIGEMVEAGILVREADGGRVIVGLSAAYVEKLDALFDDLATSMMRSINSASSTGGCSENKAWRIDGTAPDEDGA